MHLLTHHRFGKRAGRMGVDEVARAGACANQATTLQQVVGLEHGGRADAVGLAGIAHRWHALAGAEDAGADQFCDVVGKFFVAFHGGLISFLNVYAGQIVGAGLPAKAVCQSLHLLLLYRFRRQASSHI